MEIEASGEAPTALVATSAATRRTRSKAVAGGLIVVALTVAGFWGWRTLLTTPALDFQEHQTILMGPPANLTDDRALGDALRTALQISLEQSRYVDVLSPQRVQEALARMRQAEAQQLTEQAALEICEREGAKALIGSRVERVGHQFVLTARIIDPTTGSTVRTLAERTDARGDILGAADRLARLLRLTLGESLGSISRSSVKLAEATTASLDALKLYSQASDLRARGRVDEARTFLERAIELDPEFARAYADLATTYRSSSGVTLDPGKAERYFKEALGRLEKVGERERFEIRALYHSSMQRWDEAVPLYRSLIEGYPRVEEYRRDLGTVYRRMGRHSEAIVEFQEALKLNPRPSRALLGLAISQGELGQKNEEVASLERAFALEPEWETDDIQNHQYGWALIQLGKEARARAAFGKMLAKGGAKAARGHRSLGILALYRGRLNDASRELRDAARTNEVLANGLAAARERYYLAEALTLVERRDGAAIEIARGVELLKKDAFANGWLALRFAALWSRTGRLAEAARLMQILRPKVGDSSDDQADALRAEGELALARGSIEEGIETLRRAMAAWPWLLTRSSLARGLALGGNKEEAIRLHLELVAEGAGPWEGHVDWALVHLRLGRLYEQIGETAKAREMYLALLQLWNEADADLKPLREAREALRRVSPG